MPKSVRSLTDRQIDLLRKMPGISHYTLTQVADLFDGKSTRTFNSLVAKGVLGYDTEHDDYFVRWGVLSVVLNERIFPSTTRQTYERELKRLNEMALDFSEGSNANFMRQITVVKNLREMVIKAEQQ